MRVILLLSVVSLLGCAVDKEVDDSLSRWTHEMLNRWVHNYVEYKDDPANDIQSPAETLEKGTGDCEDYVILWMYLVNQKTGGYPDFVIVEIGEWQHVVGDMGEGVWYDPTGGKIIPAGYWPEHSRVPYLLAMIEAGV